MEPLTTHHLVRSEDLNHHATLFAGRISEWLVETGYMTATQFLQSNHLVCVNIHDIQFRRPVHSGEIVRLDGTVVKTGRTSLQTAVSMTVDGAPAADASITFVHVNAEGRPEAHGKSLA